MKFIVGMGNKNQAIQFTQIMINLKSFTDSLSLRFDKNGLYAQGMSYDHVSLFEFQLLKDWFQYYEFKENDSSEITINCAILQKIFQMWQPHQHIVMEFNGTPDTISIQFNNMKKSNLEIPKKFDVQLMEVDQEQMSIPDVDFDAEFIILIKVLENLCNQLSVFDESIHLTCSENNIDFSSLGIEGKINVSLFNDKVDCIEQYTINEDHILKLEFSNSHFQNFCKFSKLSKEVKLCFAEKYPMQMIYRLNGEKNNMDDEDLDLKMISYLRFYLAPKINDDDEDGDD